MIKAGFAEAHITPAVPVPIGGYGDNVAADVLSPLVARALVVETDGASWALAACDLIGLDRHAICLPVIQRLKSSGFTGGVILTASHTHSGPHTRFNYATALDRRDDAYIDRLNSTLVDIVLEAARAAAPAEVAASRAFAAESVNRRVNMPDGSHHYLPNEKHLYQFATGPTDLELGLLAFRCIETCAPIAAVINYTAHALTIGNHHWTVTADYPGVLTDEFTRLSGSPSLFTQGACGNVHPFGFETGPSRMHQMGRRLAEKAFEAFASLQYVSDPPVRWARRAISLPVQKSIYDKKTDCAPDWQNLDSIEADMTAVRVGDAVFVGVPGELFVEVGLAIKRSSPFPFTWLLYNANSYASYIPTPEAYAQGGYEPGATLVAPGGAVVVEETARWLTKELFYR